MPLINNASRKLYIQFGVPSKAQQDRLRERKKIIEDKLYAIRRQAEVSAAERKLMSERRIINDPREPISVVIMKEP